MFWGLIMEPQRRYTQQVKKAFHISMASLDISTSSEEPAQVMCSFEGRNYLLCTLRKPDVLQCPLDLNFEVGSELSFAANGKCHVHLTGYLIDEPISDGLDGVEEEEEDVEEQESEDETINNKKRSKKEQNNGPPAKKAKGSNAKKSEPDSDSDDESDVDIKDFLEKSLADSEDDTTFKSDDEESGEEEEDEEDDDEEEEDEGEEEEDEGEESSLSEAESDEEQEVPSPKKKNNQVNGIAKPGQADKSKKDKNQQPKPEQKEKGKKEGPSPAPKKKVLNGGVIVEEIKEGDGAPAKPGKFVTVYYEGRLKQNNKVFDSAKKGAGFSFRLGAGEVIKGWDVGVVGMKPGSKRRIICPPAMAYGQKGSPPAIPGNSTLIFEVELKKIR